MAVVSVSSLLIQVDAEEGQQECDRFTPGPDENPRVGDCHWKLAQLAAQLLTVSQKYNCRNRK